MTGPNQKQFDKQYSYILKENLNSNNNKTKFKTKKQVNHWIDEILTRTKRISLIVTDDTTSHPPPPPDDDLVQQQEQPSGCYYQIDDRGHCVDKQHKDSSNIEDHSGVFVNDNNNISHVSSVFQVLDDTDKTIDNDYDNQRRRETCYNTSVLKEILNTQEEDDNGDHRRSSYETLDLILSQKHLVNADDRDDNSETYLEEDMTNDETCLEEEEGAQLHLSHKQDENLSVDHQNSCNQDYNSETYLKEDRTNDEICLVEKDDQIRLLQQENNNLSNSSNQDDNSETYLEEDRTNDETCLKEVCDPIPLSQQEEGNLLNSCYRDDENETYFEGDKTNEDGQNFYNQDDNSEICLVDNNTMNDTCLEKKNSGSRLSQQLEDQDLSVQNREETSAIILNNSQSLNNQVAKSMSKLGDDNCDTDYKHHMRLCGAITAEQPQELGNNRSFVGNNDETFANSSQSMTMGQCWKEQEDSKELASSPLSGDSVESKKMNTNTCNNKNVSSEEQSLQSESISFNEFKKTPAHSSSRDDDNKKRLSSISGKRGYDISRARLEAQFSPIPNTSNQSHLEFRSPEMARGSMTQKYYDNEDYLSEMSASSFRDMSYKQRNSFPNDSSVGDLTHISFDKEKSLMLYQGNGDEDELGLKDDGLEVERAPSRSCIEEFVLDTSSENEESEHHRRSHNRSRDTIEPFTIQTPKKVGRDGDGGGLKIKRGAIFRKPPLIMKQVKSGQKSISDFVKNIPPSMTKRLDKVVEWIADSENKKDIKSVSALYSDDSDSCSSRSISARSCSDNCDGSAKKSVILSLSSTYIQAVLACSFTNIGVRSLRSTVFDEDEVNGGTLIVFNSKDDIESYERYFRLNTSFSVLNHGNFTRKQRKEGTFAHISKTAGYDIVLTTIDAIKVKEHVLPVSNDGHVITKKLINDSGWYSKRTSQDSQATIDLSLLHTISWCRTVFIDIADKKSFTTKPNNLRSRAAVALKSSRRHIFFPSKSREDDNFIRKIKDSENMLFPLALVLHLNKRGCINTLMEITIDFREVTTDKIYHNQADSGKDSDDGDDDVFSEVISSPEKSGLNDSSSSELLSSPEIVRAQDIDKSKPRLRGLSPPSY